MKIRTQSLVTMLLFGVILLFISTSAIVTNQLVQRVSEQEDIAGNVARGANELSYLTNDYVIYRESQQLNRWQIRFVSFSTDVAQLRANNAEQTVLVNNIQVNARRLKEVFDSIASSSGTSQNQSPALDTAFLQVSWSRMVVQSQGLVSDATRLAELLHSQSDRLEQMNNIIIIAMSGAFAAYFIAGYILMQRRVLKSVAALQKGTEVVGSGNLDYTIEAKRGNDEIKDLAHAFNRMTSDLKSVTISKTALEKEIDERKQVAKALRESEERFRAIAETTAVLLSVSRVSDGTLVFVNDAYSEAFGYNPGELIGGKVLDLYVNPADRDYLVKTLSEQGFINHFEVMGKHADGTPFWVSSSVRVINYGGEPVYLSSSMDITERKKAEAEILHLASFPELDPNPILELDEAGHLTYLNPAARTLFPDLSTLGSSHPFLAGWEALVNMKGDEKTPLPRRESKIGDSWYEQTVQRVPSSQNLRIYGRDTTGRKEAEESLQVERDKLMGVLNSMEDGVCIMSPDFSVEYVNPSLQAQFGDVNGQKCYRYFNGRDDHGATTRKSWVVRP